MVDAVILAGGEGEVIDPSCRFKGLLPVAGRPLVEWVLDAFLAADRVRDIAVVMPTAEGLGPWVDKVGRLVVSDHDFMDNVLAGLAVVGRDSPVLVATGDIPLITPEAVDHFVEASLATGKDFTYPLITREDMEAQYPGSVRTYFRLKSGWHTGGNMMMVEPRISSGLRDLGQELFDRRKSPVAMMRIAGFGFVVKLVTGQLDPDELASKITDIIGGGTAAAVTSPFASLAVDVDKAEDRELVEAVLEATIQHTVPSPV